MKLYRFTQPYQFSYQQTKHVLIDFHKKGLLATVILNRPKQLNPISVTMFQEMEQFLQEIKSRNTQIIILRGAGGNLSAGGDIKSAFLSKHHTTQENQNLLHDLFYKGYTLGYHWASIKPLVIGLMEGYSVGGINGWIAQQPFRICTEKTVYSIPELKIGSFIDVGGAYWINKRNDKLGHFLAFTGHKMRGSDLLNSKFASHLVHSEDVDKLYTDLLGQKLNKQLKSFVGYTTDRDENIKLINSIISKYQRSSPNYSLQAQLQLIEEVFQFNSIDQLFQNFERLRDEPQVQEYKEEVEQQCPLSVKLFCEYLKQSKGMSLREVFLQDYRISQRLIHGKDFSEGVKSALINKNHKPHWTHPHVSQVTQGEVDYYFTPLKDSEKDLPI